MKGHFTIEDAPDPVPGKIISYCLRVGGEGGKVQRSLIRLDERTLSSPLAFGKAMIEFGEYIQQKYHQSVTEKS